MDSCTVAGRVTVFSTDAQLTEVSAQHPDVVDSLWRRIAHYRATMVDAAWCADDPSAYEAFRKGGGYIQPWYDDDATPLSCLSSFSSMASSTGAST